MFFCILHELDFKLFYVELFRNYCYTANFYPMKTTGTGNCGVPEGKSALCMEKGCKNHKETLAMYIVDKPCNIYRLRGNPMIIIGFPHNL